MLRTIKIENFRRFKSFELNNLGRFNLLVGTNNSGKTSILEAIQLLCSHGNLEPLLDTMENRGEYFFDENKKNLELDIRHLFYDHYIEKNSQFSIKGNSEETESIFLGSIDIAPNIDKALADDTKIQIFLEDGGLSYSSKDLTASDFGLSIGWIHGKEKEFFNCSLSSNGGLPDYYIRRMRRVSRSKDIEMKTQFITSSALTPKRMTELFNDIVLTPEEDTVLEAIRTIDPRIQRIASVTSDKYLSSRTRDGFVVRLSDTDQRVPIGSMGDGVWRMLGLALAAVSAANGVLLVDEIDTGLHFRTMSNMWKLIWKIAKELNVQVFATTHSSDCWTSLATIARREDVAGDGITIQRIERNKNAGIVFSEDEIVMAAEQGIEVR